ICTRALSSDFAAAFRTRAGDALSFHSVAANRAALPALADLFGIRRRSDRPVRSVGRRLDDARAHPALPFVRHVGARLRAARPARARTLVSPLALRPLAG